jgi:hypothetical protein
MVDGIWAREGGAPPVVLCASSGPEGTRCDS